MSDITSVAYLWPIDGKYYFKVVNYLPSDALATKENSVRYREFDMRGELTIFPDSNVTDYDRILDDIKAVAEVCPVMLISYDQWNSTQMIITRPTMASTVRHSRRACRRSTAPPRSSSGPCCKARW